MTGGGLPNSGEEMGQRAVFLRPSGASNVWRQFLLGTEEGTEEETQKGDEGDPLEKRGGS